jgi:hypothetical protein
MNCITGYYSGLYVWVKQLRGTDRSVFALRISAQRFQFHKLFHRLALRFAGFCNLKSLQHLPRLRYSDSCMQRLFFRRHATFGERLESCAMLQKSHPNSSDRTVSLLGNDDLRPPLQFRIILLINFLAEDKHH